MKAEEKEWRKRVEEYRGSGESLGRWCRRNGCKRRRLKYWLERFSEEDEESALGEEVSWTEMKVEDAGDDFAGDGNCSSNRLRRTAPERTTSERTVLGKTTSDCLGKSVSEVLDEDISAASGADDPTAYKKFDSESEGTFEVRYRGFELVLPKGCLGDVVKAVVKYA